MVSNSETQTARAFHSATKYVTIQDDQGQDLHVMGTPPATEPAIWQEDWSLEPLGFKIYDDLEPLPLSTSTPHASLPALVAIARTGSEPQRDRLPDLAALTRIARLSNGLLHRQRVTQGGMTVEFRTSGCTGARYHLELFFIVGDLPDLEAGV